MTKTNTEYKVRPGVKKNHRPGGLLEKVVPWNPFLSNL